MAFGMSLAVLAWWPVREPGVERGPRRARRRGQWPGLRPSTQGGQGPAGRGEPELAPDLAPAAPPGVVRWRARSDGRLFAAGGGTGQRAARARGADPGVGAPSDAAAGGAGVPQSAAGAGVGCRGSHDRGADAPVVRAVAVVR